MAEITPQMIKELRERTQAGMADCKAALVEAGGDMEKAVEIILKKGHAKSAKRAGAVATEGEVRAMVAPDQKSGVIVEVNIQTDFAARNEKFKEFVANVTRVAHAAKEGDDLEKHTYPGTQKTVGDAIGELVASIGEKVTVRRFAKFELQSKTGAIHAYVHQGGKVGVLLELAAPNADVATNPDFVRFADEAAMQIAAMNPLYVTRGEVSKAAVEKQRDIYTAQLREDPKPKPEAAWPKIIDGKVAKWYTEICLLEQDWVIEPGATVEKVRAEASKKSGGDIAIKRFVRYERGEGIEKPQDDFAAEVAKMAGS
jgi:elongation factor Ts